MRILYLLFIITVAVLAAVFAAQNGAIVSVAFFSWSATGSLSLVLILTFALGIGLGVLIMAPSVWKRSFQSSGLRRKVKRLQKENAGLSAGAAEATKQDKAADRAGNGAGGD